MKIYDRAMPMVSDGSSECLDLNDLQDPDFGLPE